MATIDFLRTKEYQRFEEFCSACFNEKYIGICYGTAGVGKTLSAKHYSKWEQYECFEKSRISKEERSQMNQQLRFDKVIYYPVPVVNSPRQIEKALSKWRLRKQVAVYEAGQNDSTFQQDSKLLIILDEADRLKVNTLEQVRHMYDEGDLSIIFIGMPGLEKRLSRYAQLYSRIGFAHQYRPVGKEEMIFILEHYWNLLGIQLRKDDPDDAAALGAIMRITNGNFRLIHRLFSQIQRILTINSLEHISEEVVEAARDCLVIGNA